MRGKDKVSRENEKKNQINKAKSMISSSTLGGRNLNKSRWRGEKHGGSKKRKESIRLQLLPFVDHCRHLKVPTIAFSVAMNFLLDIQRIRKKDGG